MSWGIWLRGTRVLEAEEEDEVPTNRFLGRDADDLGFTTDLRGIKDRQCWAYEWMRVVRTYGPASALMFGVVWTGEGVREG